MRVRFAPSPTGQLHVGNARTALFNWLLARGQGGTFILRIEDTDVERSTRESEAAILRDLRWLGLDWDEGPDIGGRAGPIASPSGCTCTSRTRRSCSAPAPRTTVSARRRSSTPSASGARRTGGRRATPARAAACRASRPSAHRRRRAAGDPLPRARGSRRRLRGRRPRRRALSDRRHRRSGDRPRRRPPAYNFAVVVDDALMEVTHVIRGEDHISNTPRQILLVRGARLHAAGVRAPRARDGARPQPAVETPRRDVGGGVSREGLPARGARELPRAHRLVAATAWGRRQSCCRSRSWRAAFRSNAWGERRRVRRRQARVGEPPLLEARRSSPARRAVAAVFPRRPRAGDAR